MTAVVLLGPAGAYAATPAEERFAQGVAAARAGDYEAAVAYFEAAREAGLDTGALHFNLGVAYYRTGRIEAAESAFVRASRSETMVAPALYQLGRIARERGDEAEARRYFRRAADWAKTEAMHQHARAALERVSPPAIPDYVYLSFGGGYDSNLALTPSDASGVSEESDPFVEGVLVVRHALNDRDYLRLGVYLQGFFDADADLFALQGGAGRVGRLGGWRWDAFIDGRHREFGDETFDNAVIAGGTLWRELEPRWVLDLDYRLELVRGPGGFGFLDGYAHEFTATLDQPGIEGWRLAVGVDMSERDDRETADDFFSFSWNGYSLAGEYRWRLDARHLVELGADWTRRDYEGAEVRNGARLGGREDDRTGLGVALERRLQRGWLARFSLRVEERDSNLAEFDYDREVIRVAVEHVF